MNASTRYIVEAPNGWYLRGTTWTSDVDRADRFVTQADALAALGRAKRFMKPAVYKQCRIGLEPTN